MRPPLPLISGLYHNAWSSVSYTPALVVTRSDARQVRLDASPDDSLEWSNRPADPWEILSASGAPWTIPVDGVEVYFRVRRP